MCVLLLPQYIFAETAYYSFQLGSFRDKADALLAYETVRQLPQARVEKIGQYYALRVGYWEEKSAAEQFAVTQSGLGRAVLRTAYLRPERMITRAQAAAETMRPGQDRVKPRADEPADTVQPQTADGVRTYSFQLGSFLDKEPARLLYKQVKELPQARVEKIGRYYTVRIGLWEIRQTAEAYRATTRRVAPDAFLRIADWKHERVLTGQPFVAQEPQKLANPAPAAPVITADIAQANHANHDRGNDPISESLVDFVPARLGVLPKPDTAKDSSSQLTSVNASVTRSPDRLSLNRQNVPLSKVIDDISQEFGIKILVGNSSSEKVQAHFTDMPVERVLERLLKDKNYVFFYRGDEPRLREIMIYD